MNQNQTQHGKLIGIGVGPGDPELLTYKAARLIREADLLCLPNPTPEECMAYQITKGLIPEIADKELLCLNFVMTKDKARSDQMHAELYEILCGPLSEGRTVTFLTIGDPTVYSTFSYMADRAKEDGYPVEITNGIPSFCAVAAIAGIPLAEGPEDIHILSGRGDLSERLALDGTKVVMKIGANAVPLKQQLTALAASRPIDVWLISEAGKPQEQIFRGIDAIPDQIPYMSIAIVKDLAQ